MKLEFVSYFSSLFVSFHADLVLKDKIVVYDLAGQRIGWANYDCKFPYQEHFPAVGLIFTVPSIHHYLIGLKGETWIKSEIVFSDTDTLEIQFLVQDSQNLGLCMMNFLKYLISHFFIFSRTDLLSHYLDREDKEQPEKRLHNLRYVVIW